MGEFMLAQSEFGFLSRNVFEPNLCFILVIFQIRLYALYGLNKKVSTMIFSVFLACSAISAWVLRKSTSSLTGSRVLYFITYKFDILLYSGFLIDIPQLNMTICYPAGLTSLIRTFWIPILVFETLLCSLVLLRGYQSSNSGDLKTSGNRLMHILIRDSVIYYVL